MKLISLNIWGGKAYEPLLDFIKKHAGSVDIFCFQEVFMSPEKGRISEGSHLDIYDDIKEILADYNAYFGSAQDGWNTHGPVDEEVSFGQATFIKEGLKTEFIEHVFLAGGKNGGIPGDEHSMSSAMLCTKISEGKKEYVVCNIHGISGPGTKLDTEKRIMQSKNIVEFYKKENNENFILCGDFNLMPDTKSMEILEENLESLIKTFKVKNTRSTLSSYYRQLDAQKFADYTLVGRGIMVKDFKVLQDQVSDHLAMYLDFE